MVKNQELFLIFKKVSNIIFILIITLMFTKVYAKTTELYSDFNQGVYASPYSYTIDSYNINIKVNENNILDINEKISANFNVRKHGIIRKIPLKNTVIRLDGTSESNNAIISNINVNGKYSVYQEGIYKVIKIGDTNNTIIGPKDYQISYSYNLGKDKTNKYDELYFNLIGPEWDTAIDNITFKIVMPKNFDASKLGFSSGIPGSTDSSKITYQVDGNTITGSYNGYLSPGEALTIRLELPEGYFKNFVSNTKIKLFTIIAFVFGLISLIITYIMWRRANNNKIVETVEFYPPDNINSIELSLIYNGKVSSYDIISLLIILANKGYLTISETISNSDYPIREIRITKLKEYDGTNEYEKRFFDGLFICNDVVTEKELSNGFFTTIDQIKILINSPVSQYKIFEAKSLGYKNLVLGMIIIIMFLISIQLNQNIENITEDIIPIMETAVCNIPSIIGLTVVFYQLTSGYRNIPYITFFSILAVVPWLFSALPLLITNIIGAVIYFLGIITVLVLFKLRKNLKRRTQYGEILYGKIKGFRRFLETTSKAQLEALVEKNPTYFFDILPYTYVLGISRTWIQRFEKDVMIAPGWLYSDEKFNINVFDRIMEKTNSAMTKTPIGSGSSNSSGGRSSSSSGGGSSGRGSGGGGGSSW